MVAETPASDNLRMSAEIPELVIRVDAQIPNRGADFFSAYGRRNSGIGCSAYPICFC